MIGFWETMRGPGIDYRPLCRDLHVGRFYRTPPTCRPTIRPSDHLTRPGAFEFIQYSWSFSTCPWKARPLQLLINVRGDKSYLSPPICAGERRNLLPRRSGKKTTASAELRLGDGDLDLRTAGSDTNATICPISNHCRLSRSVGHNSTRRPARANRAFNCPIKDGRADVIVLYVSSELS